MNYIENLNNLLDANSKDHEISEIESKLIDVVRLCAENTDTMPIQDATGTSAARFETAINNAWKLVYLIPMITLEDKPEKWVIVEDSPMYGKDFRTSEKTTVHVSMLERHVDTIDGTPACIYRINGNSKLAFMLYGNNVIEYKTKDGKDMELSNTYACACFIDAFPFTVPFPTVTTIIHVANDNGETEDYGFISDIRNISREEIDADDLKTRFFSPIGTSLYPSLSIEECNELASENHEQCNCSTPCETCTCNND